MSVEGEVSKRLADALKDSPIALDETVFGDEALSDENLRANFVDIIARLIPALSDSLVLLAKEIDALKTAVGPSEDESAPR